MSNALEAASLIMVPSGYEDGTLGSLKPTDGSGDFTFSRGNNLSATRINEQGYIEKGYENTLLASNDFARDDSSYTITSGEQGYDGTTDAWLVNKLVTGNAYFGKNGLVYTGVMTISFHLKAGTLDRLAIITAGDYVVFDLANVTATKFGGAPITQTIELVSGTTDWYRCSMTINKNETNNIRLKPVDTSNQDAAGTIYIQDAMLNQGLVAYPYIETTTAPVAGGILEDMPRLDWSGSCPALLLEPQRTNLVTHSEYFYGSGYNISTPDIIESNSTTSPEGFENASKLTTTQSGSGTNKIENIHSGRTISVFAKAGEESEFLFFGATAGQGAYFNLSDGSVAGYYQGNSSNIDDAYSIPYNDGWYRFVVVFSLNTSSRIFVSQNQQITFNRTAGNGIYIYGLQAEQDATYETSYIPTYGVSQTRLADVCDRGSNLAYTGAYTLFIEFELTKDAVYFLSNTSLAYRLFLERDDAYFKFGSSNVFFQGMFDWEAALGTNIKMLIYKNGTDAAMFVNGTKYTPSSNALTTGNEVLDWRYLNYSTAADRQEQAYIKKLVEFQTALSDEECIALTTIT